MRKPHEIPCIVDWCTRHIVATYVLTTFLLVVTLFGSFYVFFPPHSQVADAKPVKTPAPTVSCTIAHSNDYKDYVDECKVTLKDGRTVTCVNIAKGTSCDWAHATTKKGK